MKYISVNCKAFSNYIHIFEKITLLARFRKLQQKNSIFSFLKNCGREKLLGGISYPHILASGQVQLFRSAY